MVCFPMNEPLATTRRRELGLRIRAGIPHWTFGLIDLREKKAYHLDSMKGIGNLADFQEVSVVCDILYSPLTALQVVHRLLRGVYEANGRGFAEDDWPCLALEVGPMEAAYSARFSHDI